MIFATLAEFETQQHYFPRKFHVLYFCTNLIRLYLDFGGSISLGNLTTGQGNEEAVSNSVSYEGAIRCAFSVRSLFLAHSGHWHDGIALEAAMYFGAVPFRAETWTECLASKSKRR